MKVSYVLIILFVTIALFLVKGVFGFLFVRNFAGMDLVGNYAFTWLMHTLLAEGRITGWTNVWFAGMPAFRFYPPLFFIITAGLNYLTFGLLSLSMAYKIVVFSSLFFFPLVVYFSFRRMGFKGDESFFISLWSLAFLFLNGIYSGINQTLNFGLVAQMFALNLYFVFLGEMFHLRNLNNFKWEYYLLPSLLLSLTILSHFYVGILAVISLLVIALISFSLKQIKLVSTVTLIGFLLSSFWWLPVLSRMYLVPTFYWNPVNIGNYSLLFMFFSLFFFVKLKFSEKTKVFFVLLFFLLLFLGIKGLPFKQLQYDRFFSLLFVCGFVLAGVGSYNFLKYFKIRDAKVKYVLFSSLILLIIFLQPLTKSWESDLEINSLLQWLKNNSDSQRILVESDAALLKDYEVLDSVIPIETGNPVMNNIHVDSLNGPYLLALTNSISTKSTPNPLCSICQFKITDNDLIKNHLTRFAIKYVISSNDNTKTKLEEFLQKRYEDDKFTVFENSEAHEYYEVLQYKPVLVITDYNKGKYSWKNFTNAVFLEKDLVDVTFVYSSDMVEGDFSAVILLKNIDIKTQLPIYRPTHNMAELVEELKKIKLEKHLEKAKVTDFEFSDNKISFFVDSKEKVPVLIKFTYFPFWKSHEKVYLANPFLMLVFAKGEVILEYN